MKLDRYIDQAKLLIDNKIETTEDLETYKSSVEERLTALEAERTACRNLLRRTTGRKDGPRDEELNAQIKHLSGEIKQARKDLKCCGEIAERYAQLHQNLSEQQRNNRTPVQEHSSHNCERKERYSKSSPIMSDGRTS